MSAGGGRDGSVRGRAISSVSFFFFDLRNANKKPRANIEQAPATDPIAIPALAPEEMDGVDLLQVVIVDVGPEVHVGCGSVAVVADVGGLSTIGGL